MAARDASLYSIPNGILTWRHGAPHVVVSPPVACVGRHFICGIRCFRSRANNPISNGQFGENPPPCLLFYTDNALLPFHFFLGKKSSRRRGPLQIESCLYRLRTRSSRSPRRRLAAITVPTTKNRLLSSIILDNIRGRSFSQQSSPCTARRSPPPLQRPCGDILFPSSPHHELWTSIPSP